MTTMCTEVQLSALLDFLKDHKDLAQGRLHRTMEGRSKGKRLWKECANILNSVSPDGPQKSADGWRTYYSDYKSKILKKVKAYKASLSATGSGEHTTLLLTPLQERLYNILGRNVGKPLPGVRQNPLSGETSADENTAPSTFATSKRIFQKVRSRCVNLIVKHGRPAELLDDLAFRDILNLIPMSKLERSKLTSQAIKEYIDSTDAAEEKSMAESFQDDPDDDEEYKPDDDTEMEILPEKRKVKNEKEECICPSRDTGRHVAGCPAHAQDTYWQYFDVSIDEATCKICSSVIKWTSMSDLKMHMTVRHPNIEFKDDDEEFTNDRGKPYSEHGDGMEEIYLEEDYFQPSKPTQPAPSTAKKRKYPAGTVVTLRDSETICIERFKSLDRFGLYIASLMKLLPEEKSLKYQEQIVQRLIREQAAAG